jgi:type I restriction enzyme S subunit
MSPLPRYESYKDSGVEWLGEIPSHWNTLPLRAFTELKSEKNHPELQILSVYRDYGVIQKDSRDDNHNATSLDTHTYKVVNEGDLVVNKMKAWQGSMGVSDYKGLVSPAYITCRIKKDKILPKYLHYLLRSKPYIGVYSSISYGVRIGQWDMHYEDFKKISIPQPHEDEMRKIVNFLDQKTAEIDAAIAKKEQLIALLQEQKAILINQAVTKGLNPNAPMKDSGVEWLGEIPKHWEVLANRYIFTEHNSRSAKGEETHLSMSQKLGLVPASQVEVLTLQSESYEGAKLCLQGDIVLNRLKAHLSVFSVAPCDGLVSPDYSVFRLKNNTFNPYFFENLFKTPAYLGEFNKRVKGIVIGFYRLYSGDFKAIPCLVPPKDEQYQIMEKIEKINNQVAGAYSGIRKEITHLNELKKTLISEVVTGKILIN